MIIQTQVCQAQREAEPERPIYDYPTPLAGAPGREAGIGIAGATPDRAEAEVVERVSEGGRQRLRLRFTVPKGKVAGLMGVMNLLQHKFNRLEVVLAAQEGAISEQDYEDKIKEAFRQMGIEVREE